ncbi:hypothetical protein HY490_05495 [Candidatus Woesearchaeota archaeon]|nr:hypothetical protein [Candidatus Woesearchaeota archaeon]
MRIQNSLATLAHSRILFFLIILQACSSPLPTKDLDKFFECADGRFVKFAEECFANTCRSDEECSIVKFSGPCGAYDVPAPKGTVPPTLHATRCNEQNECRAMPAACAGVETSKYAGVRCSNSMCVGLQQQPKTQPCLSDAECVPSDCCHPRTCVHTSQQADCRDIICTQECQPGTLDCGGSCACEQGTCVGKNFYSE